MYHLNVREMLILFFIAAPCFADPVTLVFGNGVTNSRLAALESLAALEKLVGEDSRFNEHDINFKLAYNNTSCIPSSIPFHGCGRDLWEAHKALGSGVTDGFRFWLAKELTRIDPETKRFVMDRRVWSAEGSELISIAAEISNPKYLTFEVADAIKHALIYTEARLNCRKAVLVAHSQGNLFGNLVSELLEEEARKNFRMVSVATPDNDVQGDASADALYTTLYEDKIHEWYIDWSALPPNIKNSDAAESSWEHHAFIDSYLRGAASKGNILNDLVRAINAIEEPCPSISDVLVNGSFTYGDTGWLREQYVDSWIGTNLPNFYTPPGYATLGTDYFGNHINQAEGQFSQVISIPEDASQVKLKFLLQIDSEETSGSSSDRMSVRLLNPISGIVLDEYPHWSNVDREQFSSYASVSIDLSFYRGQSVNLVFYAKTDSTSPTVFRIDDVAVEVIE